MFRLTKPTSTDVDRVARMHSRLNLEPSLLGSRQGLRVSKLPAGFAHDLSRSHIGTGRKSFETAARAFEEWKQFDLGWVAVANPGTRIDIGEIVAVEVRSLGLWSLNLSQIVDVTREREAFGFIYKTTPHHAEEGEERFLLTFDPQTEQVHYELEAVSRPHTGWQNSDTRSPGHCSGSLREILTSASVKPVFDIPLSVQMLFVPQVHTLSHLWQPALTN